MEEERSIGSESVTITPVTGPPVSINSSLKGDTDTSVSVTPVSITPISMATGETRRMISSKDGEPMSIITSNGGGNATITLATSANSVSDSLNTGSINSGSGSSTTNLGSGSTTSSNAKGNSTTMVNNNNPVVILNKQRLQELVLEIDPKEQLDEDVEDMLLNIADDFIDNVVTSSCQLAKHRGAKTLEVKDVQLILEKNWSIFIPGFGSLPLTEELKHLYKKSPTTEAHKQRLALIRKTVKKF